MTNKVVIVCHCVYEDLLQQGDAFYISVNVAQLKKKKKSMMQTKTPQISLDMIFFNSPPSLVLLLLLKWLWSPP